MAVLLCVVGLLFFRSLHPDLVMFNNDGPLGWRMAEPSRMPQPFLGSWNSLNWAGFYHGMAGPSLTNLTSWLLGPLTFAKLFTPFCLLFLGVCTAVFLRSIGLSYVAATLGGMAAMLNGDFLSMACWGIVTWCTCIGLCYLAIAALADERPRRRWLRVLIAGATLGLAISDGADVGAIFSLCVAAFIVYQAFIAKGSSLPVRLSKGVITTAVVAVASALVAFHTINSLVGTQIKGVSGMKAEERSSQERWDWATQWSLPKKEILSVAVPG